MMVRKNIDVLPPLTEEERKMLEEAVKRPIVFDEDSPELTEEQHALLRQKAMEKRAERNRQSVTIRLSPQALRKAKSLGKGYTSVLSRILESALSDNDTIERFL